MHDQIFHSSQLYVKRDQQKQKDERVQRQWKNSRFLFFTHQLPILSNQLQIQFNALRQNMDFFLHPQYMSNFSYFQDHSDKIEILELKYQAMEQQYINKIRECLPLTQIIQQQITNLKSIHIQYQSQISIQNQQQCTYSISAFQFFKVLHQNKLLTQVTVKGVKIEKFQQFIEALNPLNNRSTYIQSKISDWMKNYNQISNLKLAIDANLQFKLTKRIESLRKINELAYFIGLFDQIKDIKVKIKLGEWVKISDWGYIFIQLVHSLRRLKKIGMILEGVGFQKYVDQYGPLIRSLVFGRLAQFKEISQLYFKCIISFRSQVSINTFLALEDNLKTIFQNNQITHLTFHECRYFPILPQQVTTFQSISITDTSFRKHQDFMTKLIQKSQSISFIKCKLLLVQWRISEEIFNKLSTLAISQCSTITINPMSSLPSTQMRHLTIQSSGVWSTNIFSTIIPKLINLKSLKLISVSLSPGLLCTIPSNNLENLSIIMNSSMTNRDLQQIDSRWPNLTYLTLYQCKNVTNQGWLRCNFKGLMKLTIKKQMFIKGKEYFLSLRNKGIEVDYS